MKNLMLLSAIMALLIVVQSCGDNRKAKNFNQKTLVDDKGHQFLEEANEAGLAEIKAATLAENNSKNPRVIDFAKMMITDHAQLGNQLKSIAADKLVTLTDTISQAHKAMINGMMKLTGIEFDKAYMQMMQNDHSKAVQLFQDATGNTDKKVINFAKETIPTLNMHLDSAKAIFASLK
ncbi:DUF4142 domain-containing protein [Mucilaginibacter agri]|uniref:DUF4142 domain-containing protein n=1 Tax=Mucilaginibacter agri TaxID=2695265 RepID=A0A965ZLT3_9SPHI|nr:DUF4142 domain-containing protein [Mucilaginibacter agri]NCD71961.1 DUF4142 domain-containing protein [Mucilaginibacter agri]